VKFRALALGLILAVRPTSEPPPLERATRTPARTIDAIRYATIRSFPVSSLVMDAPRDQRMDIAMVIWLIRGEGHTILFDSGFHRERWMSQFDVADFITPDSAVRLAGVDPDSVTDIIVSHAHWDHMGGIDRFPNATIHIQRDEYAYYTGAAWQPGGRHGGIDEDDVAELVRRNMAGRVHLIEGDDAIVLPGIRAFTGARHTFASQYIRVDGPEPWVLASDNCYLYRNLETRSASATFDRADRQANIDAQARMIELAGSSERVVPGHDPLQFEKFAANGRVAHLTGR
jgi:glyoxylase-like metal-dependent hydrolase (beta-lactamase superfamily II)